MRNSLPYVEHGSLKYTDPNRVKAVMLMADCPPNPYVNGYGSRIPTRYAIDYLGKGMVKRHYRVYVMCYGNSGSAYIKGEVVYAIAVLSESQYGPLMHEGLPVIQMAVARGNNVTIEADNAYNARSSKGRTFVLGRKRKDSPVEIVSVE